METKYKTVFQTIQKELNVALEAVELVVTMAIYGCTPMYTMCCVCECWCILGDCGIFIIINGINGLNVYMTV